MNNYYVQCMCTSGWLRGGDNVPQRVFFNIISTDSCVKKAVSHFIMTLPVTMNAYQYTHDLP